MLTTTIFRICLGVAALILGAQLSIDLQLGEVNIPVTGQTLAVILVAYFLPNYQGFFAVLLYLVLGFFGLPVLADWSGGIDKFTGGSAGFLLGFLAAAYYVSWRSQRQKKVSIIEIVWLNILATIFILCFGNAWLIFNYGWVNGLNYGFFPFWPGAMIKVIIGAVIIFFAGKYKKEKQLI